MNSNLNQTIRTVAVLSGEDTNCGKSSLVRHMLRPGLKSIHGACRYLLVEKEGRDIPEGEDVCYRPEQMREIQMELAMCRAKKQGSVVVDVGGGQNTVFQAGMKEAKGSTARVDLYVLPVVPTQKVDKIIETIEELLLLGVEPDRLAVVVNRAPIGRSVNDLIADGTFAPLASHSNEYGYRLITVALPNNEAIEKLRKRVSLTVESLAAGTANFKIEFERLVQAGEDDEAKQVFELEYMGGVAQSMKGHMDKCFTELFAAPAKVSDEGELVDLGNLFDEK